MIAYLTRRDFLRASAIASAALLSGKFSFGQDAAPKPRWYKGNLHMHNQWSDGLPLPEQAVAWYKDRGWDFICPSDHNGFQSADLHFTSFGSKPKMTDEMIAAFEGETSLWKPIKNPNVENKLEREIVDKAIEELGAAGVKIKEAGGMTFVRMTPFDELVEKFVEEEKFLMIPGYEHTGNCVDKRAVHMNFIGVRETFPYNKKIEEPVDQIRESYAQGKDRFGGAPYLFTANHPMWRFYDVNPSALMGNPAVRIFELINNGIHKDFKRRNDLWEPEKFWDVVNAWRASNDQELLLGMGSDDRHDYSGESKGWTKVRAERLEQNALFAAITAGDMYASNGLDFETLEFDGKTLNVKIDVKEEGPYKIDFVGTKKGYDPACKVVQVEETETTPDRKVEMYSDEIGAVLESVDGVEASYTLKPDDLYVRAKIYRADDDPNLRWKTKPAAWTQPYRA